MGRGYGVLNGELGSLEQAVKHAFADRTHNTIG